MNHLTTSSRIAGFTLVELMVALLISGVLATVGITHLWTSREMSEKQTAVIITEENARYTFDQLHTYIKNAGYDSADPALSGATITAMLYRDTCGTKLNCTMNGAGSSPDEIAIWSNPELVNRLSCNGTDLTTIADPIQNTESVVHSFYIEPDPDTDLNNLYCETFIVETSSGSIRDFVNNKNAVIEGVENIQFLYGIYDPDIGLQPQQYVSADRVPVDLWGRISSVRVTALIGSSTEDGFGDGSDEDFQLLDANTYTPIAGEYCFDHFCEVYSTTIFLENAG